MKLLLIIVSITAVVLTGHCHRDPPDGQPESRDSGDQDHQLKETDLPDGQPESRDSGDQDHQLKETISNVEPQDPDFPIERGQENSGENDQLFEDGNNQIKKKIQGKSCWQSGGSCVPKKMVNEKCKGRVDKKFKCDNKKSICCIAKGKSCMKSRGICMLKKTVSKKCKGKVDMRSKCGKKSDVCCITSTICDTICENGGTCSGPGACTCAPGWTGVTCETAICDPSCENGGTCSGPGTCSCAPGWTGNTCETGCAILGGCDANAKCIITHGAPAHICKCEVGYAGDGQVCGVDIDLDGFPDVDLSCNDVHCRKDNCPIKPNSGQEDQDANGVGDACDHTIPVVTPTAIPPCSNTLTSNCIADSDGDGIENSLDNCPDVPNMDQLDRDGDSLGDACDNCPGVTNADQKDKDQDMIGDACDNGSDIDSDGIQDDKDNCPDVPNANQLNSDDDQYGNACDNDADNDGVPNLQDNCPLVYNPSQSSNDPCLNDNDNDGIGNFLDNCPNNSLITKTDFRTFQKVDLDPDSENQPDPNWVIRNDGAEITQTENSDPGLVFGNDVFGGVDFEGTFYIEDTADDDYAGVVFSYQSNARFYLMQWKKKYQTYLGLADGVPGIILKRVNSKTGPGDALRNALWHTNGSISDQTEILWKDPNEVGWVAHVAYRWQLLHRPQIGLIRLRVLKGAIVIADSGNIYDSEIKGGRLGAFVFSQEDIIWSNLGYRCNDDVPQDSYDDLPVNLQNKVDIDHSWNWW